MARKHKSTGGLRVIDMVVLFAMAVAAIAFSLGLAMHAPIDLTPALLGGAALFLVMASSHLVLVRSYRAQSVASRLEEISEAVDFLASDTRIDQVQDDVARLELLSDRVEKLDRAFGVLDDIDMGETLARLDRLAGEIDHLRGLLESLRNDVEGESRAYREKVTVELRLLESLIKQLSQRLTVTARAQQTEAPAHTGTQASVRAEEKAASAEPHRKQGEEDEGALMEVVRQSIETDRIDLYLQPIVSLPDRKLRYYETLTRLRDRNGEPLMPEDFIPTAEAAGMMPLIDNVMLVKSVQTLQRLEQSNVHGLFCNLSSQSLLDPDFFPQFLEFMEQNSDLRETLFFEFSQPDIASFGPVELQSLKALAEIGFRFSLDHVSDLDLDFAELRDRSFHFLKIDQRIFLHGMAQAGAQIHAEDMQQYLERFDIALIIERIEDEDSLAQLIDYGVKLGQGYLLGQPREARGRILETAKSGADADAAA